MPTMQAPATAPNIASFQGFMAMGSSRLDLANALESIKRCDPKQHRRIPPTDRITGALPHLRRLVLELLFRRARVDDALLDLYRHAIEKLAARAGRTGNAFAARRIVISVVRLAHQIACVIGKELI